MTAHPAVSIIVTCYNQDPYVRTCLDSVRAQTFTDWELVITDDASTDDSKAVIDAWLRETGVQAQRVFLEPNRGLTLILNEALLHCTGTFLLQVGADDILEPDRLAAHVDAMTHVDENVAVIYSDGLTMDENGTETASSWMRASGHDPVDGDVFRLLLRGNFVLGCSATYRRSSVEGVGGWDPDLAFEDWDLLLRLARTHQFLYVDGTLSRYRIHGASMMRTQFARLLEARLTILEKWLGDDPVDDRYLLPLLQARSWRLFKVHPSLGRSHVLTAYAHGGGWSGRLRRLVAGHTIAEAAFELARRLTRPLRDHEKLERVPSAQTSV